MDKNPVSTGLARFAFAALMAVCFLPGWPRANAQTASNPKPTQSENEPAFKLHVGTNLVVVRVVVHDAQGNPVDNLRKEDFRLFDSGKQQAIAQFELKAPAAGASVPTESAIPAHFIALFFDDLDTPLSYLTYARDAADQFLSSYLQPSDRAALITASGNNTVEFTSDLKRLHEALFKIAPNEHGEDPQLRSWKNVQTLDQLVTRLSQMPGQRSLILVSPGFMSASQQTHVEAVIDRAVRSQVVINTLDPRGLEPSSGGPAEMVSALPPAPFSTGPPQRSASSSPSGGPLVDSLDPDLLITPETVLREVADATGGEYFHDDNDLKAGFHQLSGTAQAYYILAFNPSDLKLDGRFHSLKVSLTERHAGFRLQARSGYFAPKGSTTPADQADAQIQEALLSSTDLQELPVALAAGLSETSSEIRELALLAHLDAKPLHFHKEGEHNMNTLTFVFGIFDQDGNMVGLQQRRARVNVLDAQLPEFFKAGVDVRMAFQLKPGIYRIREVVTDSEDHHMTTFSKNVKVP